MVIGICKLSDVRLADFKGKPTNCLLVSSQGYVTLNNKSQRTNFRFREGDVVHFKYDPFYSTFQLSKDNGSKLILKGLGIEEPAYSCVRFKYASD